MEITPAPTAAANGAVPTMKNKYKKSNLKKKKCRFSIRIPSSAAPTVLLRKATTNHTINMYSIMKQCVHWYNCNQHNIHTPGV